MLPQKTITSFLTKDTWLGEQSIGKKNDISDAFTRSLALLFDIIDISSWYKTKRSFADRLTKTIVIEE